MRTAAIRSLLVTALLAAVASAAGAATIATEWPDYAPGDTVVITGSGWAPGEIVTIVLHEDPTMCPDHTLTAWADPNGDVLNDEFVVDQHDIGVTFTVTATGDSSGLTAETTFTDACPGGFEPNANCPPTDLSQCVVGCSQVNHPENCHPDNKSAPARNGTVCREAAGVCDVEETCDGITMGSCPADAFAPTSEECRSSTGVCDPAENCPGNGPDCPADAKSTAECRASQGVCDPAESCDGVNNDCPADAKSTAECRASQGVCDPAESCDGVNDDCPADAKSTAECRASQGVCDPAESCDGVNPNCPADAKSTAECRASAGVCDPAESCDGVHAACPPDAKSTAVCRPSAGVCDYAESCDGHSDTCPADAFKSSSTVCRAAAGVCDVAENCTGSSASCPTDAVQPDGTACTSDGNPCTSDVCNGTDKVCHHPTSTCSLITSSSLCTFDIDSDLAGNQFRLLFTPDDTNPTAWKLNASNPGQYYYNVIYIGAGNTTLNLVLPYPFVTQGNVPVHVYSDVTTAASSGITCFAPGTEIANASTHVTLDSYSPQQFDSTYTVPVTIPSLGPGGVAYVNIHLDYGLKGTANYSKNMSNDAIDATTLAVRIYDKQTYVFADSIPGGDATQSENVFKRDPGIAGLVTQSGTNEPIPNVKVQIYDASNKLVTTVYTDQDGWYMWQYKYTGKATTFTVKLPSYNQSKSVTLKSNGFVIATFALP